MSPSSVVASSLRIAVPVVLAAALFVASAQFVFIPSVERQSYERKREQMRETTRMALSLIDQYRERAAAGEFTQEEAKARALARLRGLRYGPENKDYFWVLDQRPVLLLHPFRPDLEGTAIPGFLSEEGEPLLKAMAEAVEAGGGEGFVRYRWQDRDDPEIVEPKTSFLKLYRPWGWIVGTGIYMQELQAELAAVRGRLMKVYGGIFLILAVISGYILVQARRYESQRAAAENALRRSEERYRSLFDEAGDMIFVLEGTRIVDCNARSAAHLAMNRSEIIGKNPADLSPPVQPDGRDSHGEALRRIEEAGASGRAEFEWALRNGNGETLTTEASLVRIDVGGKALVQAIVRDVTQRKRAQENMARLARAVEEAAESIIITDRDGVVEYVNPAFEKITGYAREEAVGRTPAILKSGEHDDAFYREMWETVRRGEVWTGRFENRRRDGTCYTEDATVSPILSSGGDLLGFVGVGRDVTERIVMEERMREGQKMEAVGRLAGGIAHDFNNILTAVLGFAELLEDQVREGAPADEESVRQILIGGRRARELIQQILAFSRRQSVEKTPLALGPLVKEALKLLRASIPKTVEIRSRIEDAGTTVLADPTRMHQVVMNLCTNAWQAMREEGGVLDVVLEPTRLSPQEAAGLESAGAGPCVRLAVRDTGAGIAPEILPRVFEPFFTTRERDEGTGMGLSVVHGIVKDHGGDVRAQNAPGGGALFEVFLPLAPPREDAVFLDAQTSPPRGSERLLIVDDEESIVQLLETMLASVGYEVESAVDSQRALEILRSDPFGFDLLVTDLTMPGMDGRRLAREALALNPGLPVLLVTGYGDAEVRRKHENVKRVLRKPVTRIELARAVREALA